VPGSDGLQGAYRAVQFRGAGNRPEAPDNPHREIGQAAAHRGQCHQAGRVRPLQVIGADHDRPGQGQSLHQVTERVNHPELQPRIAGHGDRSLTAAAARSRQQSCDRGPPRVGGARDAAEGARQQAERPRPLQLVRPPRGHLHAARSGVGQRLFEQACLADPGLTLNEHDRPAAAGHPVQSLAQDPGLRLAPAQPRSQRRDAH
jgi:hypothetical protein